MVTVIVAVTKTSLLSVPAPSSNSLLSVKQDGRINLQREGELDWFLSVRYTYDKITGAIGCSQEAYIDRLLLKYGMENANACKLPKENANACKLPKKLRP